MESLEVIRKGLLAAAFLLLIVSSFTEPCISITTHFCSERTQSEHKSKFCVSDSSTIWVPDNYSTIQEAIYAANAGDTIRVRNGTYYENLRVNQSVKLIGEGLPTICGESVGMWGKPTVDIDTENVTICGFIIEHFKVNEWDSGISLSRRGNITGNIIHGNIEGIHSGSGCNYNVISNNVIEGNGLGLRSDGAWNNITNNIVINNGNGIYIHAPGDILINNTIANNIKYGFQLSVWGSKLRNNTISGNGVNFLRWETRLSHLICDIDTSNTVNGKPIYYWINQSYRTVPSDAGYVAVINSTNITVEGLTMEHNGQGVLIAHSSNVTVKNCNLTNNRLGVRLLSSSNVSLYHNNIVDNFHQYETNCANSWDDGYPSGGNYWSDYAYVDVKSGSGQNSTGADGIGDAPHVLDANNIDHYPLMGMFHIFNTFPGCHVNIVSNSTIEDFQYFKPNSTIKIHGSNMTATQTSGFCRICIPHVLMSEPYNVTVDGANPTHWNYTLYDNGTHRWIYFTYNHSTREVVIQGSDAAPPIINVQFPENKTYSLNNVSLTFTVDEPTSWIGYSLDKQTNLTISGNTTLSLLPEGSHNIIMYANDTAGNMGFSEMVYFAIDTTPPSIPIISPENETYATTDIPLTFIVDESFSWISYSLNDQTNVTIAGNTTLLDLLDGLHHLVVYANDTVGNIGSSNAVYFTVDTAPPNITNVSQYPLRDSVLPGDEVKVNATITDNLSEIRKVTLIYAYTNSSGTWIKVVEMTNLEGNVWNATIPAFPYCTKVTYIIMAEDKVGNTITTEEMGYEYQYHVIPEFPSFLILPLFMTATLLAVIVYRQKCLKKTWNK